MPDTIKNIAGDVVGVPDGVRIALGEALVVGDQLWLRVAEPV